MADALASLEDFAEFLGETIPAALRPMAQSALDNATAALRSRCGRTLTPGRTTWTKPHTWGVVVDLPESPVTEVHSVTVDAVASTAWRLSADGSLLFDVDLADAAVVVDYSHGYELGSRELELARGLVLRRAERRFNNPRNRSNYNGPGPDGLSFVVDMPARTWTPDELADIALIERVGGF